MLAQVIAFQPKRWVLLNRSPHRSIVREQSGAISPLSLSAR